MKENPQQTYQDTRRAHWDGIARRLDDWKGLGGYYHRRLAEVYRFLVTPGKRVLELGCGQGDLLAALAPSYGVGVDFSAEMIARARQRHPDLTFIEADVHTLDLGETFDVIILSDLINDLWDVQGALNRVIPHCAGHTRVILNFYSRVWELPLWAAEKLNLAKPNLFQNWLAPNDVVNLLNLADMEVIRHWEEVLWPVRTPLIDAFFNRFLVKLWPFKYLALTNLMVARLKPAGAPSHPTPPRVSVIVPARNEAGNIAKIFDAVPEMGAGTELVFVEGHSQDNTYEIIEQEMARRPKRPCKLFRQTGEGKGDAVRLGFAEAEGDILMIYDADMTVPPERLPRFYDVLCAGKGEFANGVRLVYPMEDEAMRFFNLLGNKFFSWVFTFLLGQPIKDTLCGTKVMWKSDYEVLAANRLYFGDFDPFGDFDLLLGAARQNLKIVEVPIRYRERTYGTTNIQRWKHGWLLLKMAVFAARKIKFV